MSAVLWGVTRQMATRTPTAVGETAGTASQYTFGTFVLWGVAIALALYLLYRRLH